MTKFFHKLMNPHCNECAEEIRQNRICSSCEVLTNQLREVNIERARLIELLTMPPKEEIVEAKEYKPIIPNQMAWRTRKNILESESREKARILKAHSSSADVEELEKEVLKEDATG